MSEPLIRVLEVLRTAAPEAFFVGGCVRDWLLGRPLKDLDIAVPVPTGGGTAEGESTGPEPCLPSSPLPVFPSSAVKDTGRAIAKALEGDFFWLREGMGVGRVVVRAATDERHGRQGRVVGPQPLQIDVVPLAGSLEEDLRRRDFTVNAMAVRVMDGLVPGAPVIDPTGGKEDLAQGRLRLAAPNALEADPLRCLRAFRFRTILGLSLAPETLAAIRGAGPGLARVSGERIRDELFVLLENDQSATVFSDLVDHELVQPWSLPLAVSARGEDQEPQSGSQQESAASESPVASPLPFPSGLDVARSLESWLAERAPRLPFAADLASTLAAPVRASVVPAHSRRAFARLAALAIRSGPASAEIAHTLRLSTEESRVLTRGVQGAAALIQARPLPGRGHLRFSRQWEPGAVEAGLLALAASEVWAAGAASPHTPYPTPRTAPLEELLADLLDRRLRPKPPLLTGEEIMAISGLGPGPHVGRYLQQVEEARADGVLRTPEEARDWLRKRLEA